MLNVKVQPDDSAFIVVYRRRVTYLTGKVYVCLTCASTLLTTQIFGARRS